MTMSGPKAPKDPTNKRKGFYVMLDKDIEASDRGKEKPAQEIYLDFGRLENSARIVGNITDENILNLLTTAKGFRELVHSIGVSVSSEDKQKEIEFIFQMYGEKDMYGGGTIIRESITANGAEIVIDLSELEWSEDDSKPGKIAFVFDQIQEMATASVKLYLHDGFDVPETEEETPVLFDSENYKQMIKKSLLQTGNNYRLKKAIEKAKKGEKVTLAYIGGSITQGAGAKPINTNCYAYKSYEAFCELFANGNQDVVEYVKAGVGGTPSELGMIRYERDVLRYGEVCPDVVVVEFAVNDEGDETKGKCYESLVRKILAAENEPAVILLFSVFANDWNLEERLCCVGKNYNLPMVSVRQAVVEQFYKKKDNGRVISKNQFFYDIYHPTNTGHVIMADCITNMLKIVDETAFDEKPDYTDVEAVIGKEFERVFLIDRNDYKRIAVITEGSFTDTDYELQGAEMNLDAHCTPQFPNNWMHTPACGSDSFKMKIACNSLLIVYKDSGSVSFGKADVYVDGELALTVDPHVNGWNHCNPLIIFHSLEKKEREIKIRMAEGEEDKNFTILGFGVVDEDN